MKIVIEAAAKINLFLDILERLDNGYHSLFMLMQSVDLYDTVTVADSDTPGIRVACSAPGIPCGQDNIAWKAAKKFYEAAGTGEIPADITIEKNIPSAAGLAGGSADAAAALYALNKMRGEPFTAKELARIGLAVGSDVPFCLTGGTMLVQDTGGVLSALPDLPACHIVLVKPDRDVSTAAAYGAYDQCRDIIHPDGIAMLHRAANADLEGVCARCANVFEQCVEVPERVAVKAVMRKHSALCSVMSGSGPTVYGIFTDENSAAACESELAERFARVYRCRPAASGLRLCES